MTVTMSVDDRNDVQYKHLFAAIPSDAFAFFSSLKSLYNIVIARPSEVLLNSSTEPLSYCNIDYGQKIEMDSFTVL